MLFTSWASYGLWVIPGLHGFAYLHINSLISGIRELRGPSKIGRYGLPRQHSDVGLWLFPNRLIILVYVRFDLLLVFPPAFIKVRPQSVGCVPIYMYSFVSIMENMIYF